MMMVMMVQYRGCTTVSVGIDLVLPPHNMFLKAELTRTKPEFEGKHGRLTRIIAMHCIVSKFQFEDPLNQAGADGNDVDLFRFPNATSKL